MEATWHSFAVIHIIHGTIYQAIAAVSHMYDVTVSFEIEVWQTSLEGCNQAKAPVSEAQKMYNVIEKVYQ